jgi:hypothetical protein
MECCSARHPRLKQFGSRNDLRSSRVANTEAIRAHAAESTEFASLRKRRGAIHGRCVL